MTTEYYHQEEEEGSFDLSQIFDIAKRRFFYFLIPAILGSITAVVVVYLIPQRYESVGTVLVESQQIPVELVQSTVTSDPNQRINVIKQRVMTRNNLVKIIDKYNVFGEERKNFSVTELVQQMQQLITVDVITAQMGRSRRNVTTIAFKVGFQHKNPTTASKVANELVTLFLSENVRTRTARASETTEFLAQEATKLRDELNTAENAISEYKRKNSESLPEHLEMRISSLERIQGEIKATERQIENFQERGKYLDLELASVKSGVLNPEDKLETVESTTEKELENAKNSLTQSLTQLTERHPTIKALKRRVAALEKKLEEELALDTEGDIETQSANKKDIAVEQLIERVNISISSNNRAIKNARSQLVSLREKAKSIEDVILKTPEIERGLIVLTRKHREILSKYQELEAKQGKARLAQNLEEEKKAERFLLLEPPITPTEPVWPDRPKFLGIGGFLAFAAGIATAVLMELLDRRVRSARELESLLKHPPLVTIPYIKTKRDIQKKRYKVAAVLFAPVSIAVAAAAGIHFMYKPLDMLFYKAWVTLEKMNLLPF